MSLERLLGLILVGGQSRRMKQAKAHLVLKDRPQWQASLAVLKPFCQQVYFSTSPKLVPPLPLPDEQLIPDLFLEPIGPLGGLISALKRYNKAFFVLACDLPFFDQEAVKMLMEFRNPQKKATVFINDDKVEPLCAIYEPSILLDLLSAFANDIYCPRKILESLDIERITPLNKKWLTNLNHAHELLELHKKQITVHYYASLREEAKKTHEVLKTKARDVSELFCELKSQYGFLAMKEDLRFAKNNQLVSAFCELFDQDEVVFIPPVSGG